MFYVEKKLCEKNSFGANKAIILLCNNNVGLYIYTFHLCKHCITFHIPLLALLGAE